MELGLLVEVHCKIGRRNVVSNKYQNSSFMPPFPAQPEGLVTSDGKSVVGVRCVSWVQATSMRSLYSRSESGTF